MNHITSWILVANASQAHLYECPGRGRGLTLIREFRHPQSRLKAADLVTDRPGHAAFGQGARRTAFAPNTAVRRNEQERFAQELAGELSAAHADRRYDKLVLIASAAFLGMVKSKLSKIVARNLVFTLDKDYTALGPAVLANELGRTLPA